MSTLTRSSLINLNQAQAMIAIESFVKAVQSKFAYPYEKFGGDVIAQQLPHLLKFYEFDHDYSEHIEVFWTACQEVGVLNNDGRLGAAASRLEQPSVERLRLVQYLMARIYSHVQGKQFKRRKSDRHYEAKAKRRHLESYVRRVLSKYARALVLRVDFGYRKEALVDIADVYHHLDKFVDLLKRRKGVFENAIGYAWVVEQGESRGYHIHFALLFPGRLHQRDGFLARQIGEVWSSLTEGDGTYHNCHVKKKLYEAQGLCGIGMIHRENEDEVDNAVRTISYLANPEKEEQFLRIRPSGRRTFAKGMLDEVLEGKDAA